MQRVIKCKHGTVERDGNAAFRVPDVEERGSELIWAGKPSSISVTREQGMGPVGTGWPTFSPRQMGVNLINECIVALCFYRGRRRVEGIAKRDSG